MPRWSSPTCFLRCAATFLSFLKLRGGYGKPVTTRPLLYVGLLCAGRHGGFGGPHLPAERLLRPAALHPHAGIGPQTGNLDRMEIGVRLFQNRINLDVCHKETKNQIIWRRWLPKRATRPASATWAKIQNRGVELTLGLVPVHQGLGGISPTFSRTTTR